MYVVPAPHHWYQKELDPGVDLDLINPRTRPIYQKEIVSKSIQDRQVIILTYNPIGILVNLLGTRTEFVFPISAIPWNSESNSEFRKTDVGYDNYKIVHNQLQIT